MHGPLNIKFMLMLLLKEHTGTTNHICTFVFL